MRKNSRLQRSALSYGAQLSFTAITLSIAIFSTPLLIKWLGEEKLGTVRAAADWAGYLGLVELGLGGATSALLAAAIHSGDPARIKAALVACYHAYRKVTVATLVFGGMLTVIIPYLVFHAGTVPQSITNQLRWATVLNVVGALCIGFAPLRSIWEVDQRGYVISLLLIIQSVISTAASLLLAYYGYGIVGQAAAILLGLITFFGMIILLTLRWYSSIFAYAGELDVDQQKRSLRKLNWPTLALNLANRVSFLSDNLVIAYFFGPSLIVPFFVTQRLAQLALSQLQSIGGVTWAGMVQLRETEGLDVFNHRLLEVTRLIVVLGLVVLVPILAYDKSFVGKWVGAKQYAGTGLVLLAVVNALAFSVPSFWGFIFMGTGLVSKLVPVSLVAAGINVVVSVSATYILGRWSPQLGMLGPLIGTMAAIVTCYVWWMPFLLQKNFGTSKRGVAVAVGKPVVVVIGFAVALVWFARRYPPQSWVSLAFAMVVSSLSLLLLCWRWGISAEERRMWDARLQHNLSGLVQKFR